MLNRFKIHALTGLLFLLHCLLVPAHAMVSLDRATMTVEDIGGGPEEVTLPYKWERAYGGKSGWARYELHFPATIPAAPQALFFSRIGNSFEVILNDVVLLNTGSHGDPYFDFAKRPLLLAIPEGLLKAENTLVLRVHAQSGRQAGVSRIVVGAVEDVTPLHASAYRWRVNGLITVSIISAVLGGLSLLLWLRQRDALYVYYGLGELLWAVRVGDVAFERSFLPWPWWGVILISSYALAPALICKFSLSLIDMHKGMLRRASNWHMVLTVPVVLLAFLVKVPVLLSVWLGMTILMCIVSAALAVWHGLRSDALEKRVLGVAVMATCAAAVRDMIVFRILPGAYGVGAVWVSYAWVAFGITLAWVIAEHMRKAGLEVANANRMLAQRLAAREAELNASFALRAEAEKQQAMTDERQRLTRDMHDGLGSQLLGILQLSQNDAVSRETLTRQLRESLDHLKLTVDAMQDTDGDIATLLGALRYRLAPRLDAAGITLTWEVESLPAPKEWTVRHSRHLQMILYEAFSNMITHAHASQAHLIARHDAGTNGDAIRIMLSDNGTGFPGTELPENHGHGLANMRLRAAHIGTSLDIRTSPEGTSIELTVPLGVPSANASSPAQV